MNQLNLNLSCEFFPTATVQGAEKLKIVRERLNQHLKLNYFSITYGAGGSNQDRSLALIEKICAEKVIPAIAHLTCVGAKKQDLLSLLQHYQNLGVYGIMALRGDLPSGDVWGGDLKTAADLVALIKENFPNFKIKVAAYPEKHPKASTLSEDLKVLKEKADLGADEAVSQYFFNPEAFLYFRDEAIKMGINIPLTAGIMPIMNFRQLASFSDNCGADLPRWIRNKLAEYENDQPSLWDFGNEVVAKICQRLISEGVNNLHFYSMNKAEPILAVARQLGWING